MPNFCFFCMDDVLVHYSNKEDQCQHLKIIFLKIREACLKLILLNCTFLKKLLNKLGHVISGERIYLLKEKVASLVNLEPSTDLTEMRHLIGLASYYGKFVLNVSNMVRPLTDLTKKYTPFKWSPLCLLSSDTIKISLASSPI